MKKQYLCIAFGRRRRVLPQPSGKDFLIRYELDSIDGCGALRGGLHLLPGPCARRSWRGVVVLDGRFPALYVCEHGATGQGDADDAAGHGLSRVDRHRGCGHGVAGHPPLPRAGYVLATVLHHNAHRLHRGAEGTDVRGRSALRNRRGLLCLQLAPVFILYIIVPLSGGI